MSQSFDFMKEFVDTNRATSFFRDLKIIQVAIAWNLMYYLQPDNIFPPEPGEIPSILKHILLYQEFDKSDCYLRREVGEFIDYIGAQHNASCGSSQTMEELISSTIDLIQYLKNQGENNESE